jgi:signal transduction histidine kinase
MSKRNASPDSEIGVATMAEDASQCVSIAHIWAQAAHDLRQPVQAALLLANVLDGVSEPSELKRTAKHIEGSLGSLLDMLDILILLSRIEARLQTAPSRACELADVLSSVMRETTDIAAERGLRLRFQRMRGVVRSHPKLLAVAVRSLVLNAIEFGNGEEIQIACRRRGNQLNLEAVFKGARIDAARDACAFVQLSPSRGAPTGAVLGLGPVLLEHLCRLLGHKLEYGKPSPDWRLLGLVLPLSVTGR